MPCSNQLSYLTIDSNPSLSSGLATPKEPRILREASHPVKTVDPRRPAYPAGRPKPLNIEPKVHHIAFPDNVFLALQPQLSGLLGPCLTLIRDEVVIGDNLRPDEPMLEIRVNHPRPPAAQWLPDAPSKPAPL